MSEDLKAAKAKIAARKRIKEKEAQLKKDKLYAKLGIETNEAWHERYHREKDAAYNAVPLEKKQAFLDLFNKGGKNLGECCREIGIEADIAAEIIMRNKEEYQLWPTKVTK
jgi:hypothetical protein